MSQSKDQFKGVAPTASDAASAPASIEDNAAAQPQSEINVEHIDTNRITGPLVVFFGPREIGKTVTLLRLCNYIRSTYQISLDQNFRTDDTYATRTAAFEALLNNMHFAPGATGNIDFLLLNITHDGSRFCQFLEAPGEHFFDRKKPNAPYPNYMNKILADDYKKIFVLFFEIDMFKSDDDFRNYSDKTASFVREKIDSARDHIIIACNKSDLHPHFRGGMPIKSEYKRAVYDDPAFRSLKVALKNSGFTYIPFIPFSAGAFNDDGTGRLVFAPSPEHYPRKLWSEIHDSLRGRSTLHTILSLFGLR